MKDFTYYSPTKFVFGQGVIDKLGPQMADMGFGKVLLVFGQGSVERSGLLDKVRASLEQAGIAFVEKGGVRPNPEVNPGCRGRWVGHRRREGDGLRGSLRGRRVGFLREEAAN